MLGGDDDVRGRVGGRHAREDGGVDHVQVVGAPDARVGVHHRGAAVAAAVVDAHLGRAHPVVGTPGLVGYWLLLGC